MAPNRKSKMEAFLEEEDEAVEEKLYMPLAKRRKVLQAELMPERRKIEEREKIEARDEKLAAEKKKQALMEIYNELKAKEPELDEKQARKLAEEQLLEATVEHKKLMSVAELAKGITYESPLRSIWKAPDYLLELTQEERQKICKHFYIVTEGEDIPPPITTFAEMRLPEPIITAMEAKGITKPTPIQIQGLPVALSGRDMMGVAFTGSGKTLVFAIPMLMMAIENEIKMPLVQNEGPLGLVLCPSRELARQTYDNLIHFSSACFKGGFPEIRSSLLIGGRDMRTQSEECRRGIHCIVATPGRLIDFLKKKRINLDICRFLCLDEADRMADKSADMGFEDDMREIIDFFKSQRQTLMFSATMPTKVRMFAQTALVKHIVVNVGRAGAANLDVIQEVEYVKQETKLMYLLECLQKTAPPVLIFCENKVDVDDIHEFLLQKGVDCAAIHGGKGQEDREHAIRSFKEGGKDVLVATDVAGKGLDFPNIQHVVNYDMPKEIENYVHRIGRTGRCGKTGLATTFINRAASESVLLDLKHLLLEARQAIPPVLSTLYDPNEAIAEEEEKEGGRKGCTYCGGLGHKITDCPKLARAREKTMAGKKDYMGGGGHGGGEV